MSKIKGFQDGKNPEYPSGAKNSPQTEERPQAKKTTISYSS